MSAAYPAHREADVVLRDGGTVHVRPVRPDDEQRLLAFFQALSEESRILRFFSSASDDVLTQRARREVTVDYASRFGLVATAGPKERVIGLASYTAESGDHAEVAFTVADDYGSRSRPRHRPRGTLIDIVRGGRYFKVSR